MHNVFPYTTFSNRLDLWDFAFQSMYECRKKLNLPVDRNEAGFYDFAIMQNDVVFNHTKNEIEEGISTLKLA